MDYITQIRKLARSPYYQNIFAASKESNINIFDNQNNYSGLQSLFLYWARVYDLLYSELAQKEWKYLSEEVLNDDVRTDAFLFYRGQQRDTELNKYKQEQKINKMNFKNPGKVNSFDIDFN